MMGNLISNNWYLNTSLIVYTMFISGWMSTYFFRKQLLLSLISLEFLILALFLGFTVALTAMAKPMTMGLYLLVMGACEATLGLCMMVSFVRLIGNDMLSNIKLVKC